MTAMSRGDIQILEHPTFGWVVGCSRKGASHVRTGKPCQDAYELWIGSAAAEPCIAIAIADGHGDDRHDLSHDGAALAVRAGVQELVDLYTSYAPESNWNRLTASFRADFPRLLSRRWREAVLADAGRRAELLSLPVGGDHDTSLLIRHGTTLVAALAVADVLLIGQIGDGGALLVKDGGEVECLLFDTRPGLGGETDSLASAEAPHLFRTVALERRAAAHLLLATDGLINAFADDEQWHAFARSLGQRVAEFGLSSVAAALPSWLDHYSSAASGDDITLAMARFYIRSTNEAQPKANTLDDIREPP